MGTLKELIADFVVDNLNSNSSESPLSARCGSVLQKEIDELKKRIEALEKGK